jgi:dihydrofolate reductase
MKAIAAMSNNRVIGKDDRIPWKCKEDLAFFKKMTKGEILIMGNTTFKNVGVLPNRFIYVLTNDTMLQIIPKSTSFAFIGDKSVDRIGPSDPVWVCGGASVYKQFLPKCSDLYLTIILDDYEGDTYMPDFEHLFPEQRLIIEKKNLWIVHYWWRTSPTEETKREGFDACIMKNHNNPYPYSDDRTSPCQLWNTGYVEAWYKGFWHE